MNPDASTLAAGGPVDLDVSKIEPGQQVVIRWRERPIFVFHRTPDQIKTLEDPKLVSLLSDPNSQQMQQPPYAANWHRSIKPEYGILVGICTHLGCIRCSIRSRAHRRRSRVARRLFLSVPRFEVRSGRTVYSGVPAPYNLPVPPHNFVSDTTIRVGENAGGSTWDFGSIRQL